MSWEPRFLQGGLKKKTTDDLATIARSYGQYQRHTRRTALRELARRNGSANKDVLKMDDEALYRAAFPREENERATATIRMARRYGRR